MNRNSSTALTLMRKGLLLTAAGTTLTIQYPSRINCMNYRICTERHCHLHYSHPSVVGEEDLSRNSWGSCLSLSPVSPLLIIFSHHWAFWLVPQPEGIVPPKVLHSFPALFLDCSTPQSSKSVFFLFIDHTVFCSTVFGRDRGIQGLINSLINVRGPSPLSPSQGGWSEGSGADSSPCHGHSVPEMVSNFIFVVERKHLRNVCC